MYTSIATAPLSVGTGNVFSFVVQDDGTNISISVQEIGGDGTSANLAAIDSTAFGTNYVGFFNRELGGHTNFLDDVLIAQVPEPSTALLLGLGLVALSRRSVARFARQRDA